MTDGFPGVIRRRLDPAQRYGLRVALFALAVVLVAVPFGFLLQQVASDGPVTETDTAVVEGLHEFFRSSPRLVTTFKVVTFLGSPLWFYFAISAAAFFFWKLTERRVATYLVVTNGFGAAIYTAIKILVARPRPILEEPVAIALGKSFPSGHAMTATVGYGTLLLAFMPHIARRYRPWAIGAYVFIVGLIAFTRLGLGVHFMSDVLGGIVLGLAWLAAATAAFSVWRRERGRPEVSGMEGVEPEEAR